MPSISIVILHLNERKKQLDRLLSILQPQIVGEAVELLIRDEPKPVTRGEKRMLALMAAKGDYVLHIDDDDLVPNDWFEKLTGALEKWPDVVGMTGLMCRGRRTDATAREAIAACRQDGEQFIHSITVPIGPNGDQWHQVPDHRHQGRNVYYRTPNHLNAIRTEIARQVGFTAKDFGEDREFSNKVLALLRNEIYISEPMYYYLA
jgi:glycosyltransferase involved in cell wall biosynthesis